MAEISIIIVSFNSRKFISRCLESISRSFKDLEHEIIIVDNGSKDGTIDLLKQKKDIILVQNGKNEGYAKACNQGAKIASGKFLFFANPDIEFDLLIKKQRLCRRRFYSHPSAGENTTHMHRTHS
jgi:GT2 family glycosyltransferase